MLRPVCSLPATRLPPSCGLLMPRSNTRVSPHAWGLLPGAPTLTGVGLAPTEEAQRVTVISATIAVSSTVTSRRTMDQNLCRRLVPRPKFGRSHPTTAAAAPATSRSVHLQVVGREQMAMTADIGYGNGLEDTFHGKAHHLTFGRSKARPRYHCNGLHRRAPDWQVGPSSWQCPDSRHLNPSHFCAGK